MGYAELGLVAADVREHRLRLGSLSSNRELAWYFAAGEQDHGVCKLA